LERWQRRNGGKEVIGKRILDEWGSDLEGSTGNGGGRDWWHHDAVGAGRA